MGNANILSEPNRDEKESNKRKLDTEGEKTKHTKIDDDKIIYGPNNSVFTIVNLKDVREQERKKLEKKTEERIKKLLNTS